eukprot:gene32116-41642_t
MRRLFSPHINDQLTNQKEADHSAAIESIVTEVKYELDNLAYEEGKLLALRAHLANVQYMQVQNSHKDRILDAYNHTNRALELENQALKIEQTKRHDDASRIRDLEITLSQTFEDKKKIERLYIDTSNSLKEAVQEISTLSRRNFDLTAVVEEQKKELEVERSASANLSTRLVELGSRVVGRETLVAEIEQWKALHANLESILSAFKVQHTTMQHACSREISDLKESLKSTELQKQSQSILVNDLTSSLRKLSHDADIVSATLKLSTVEINLKDEAELVGLDLFGKRAELFRSDGHQDEAERHVLAVAEFIRRLLRKVFHMQKEQQSNITMRSIECIRRIPIDTEDLNDTRTNNLHLQLHTLIQNLVEYTLRLESSLELERQEKNSLLARYDELARSHKIQLQQMRDDYSTQVSEAQRASEEALSAIYIAQKETQRDVFPHQSRAQYPPIREVKSDYSPGQAQQFSFCLEHSAFELSALQEKISALSMAYKYICKRNEELVEAESRIQLITEYCLEMGGRSEGDSALADWRFDLKNILAGRRQTGMNTIGRRGKFRPFRVVAIAVLAVNRVQRLLKQRRKMEMRISSYYRQNWPPHGDNRFASLPSIDDCSDMRSADIAHRVVQTVLNFDRQSNRSRQLLPSRSLLSCIKLGGFSNDYSDSPTRSSYRDPFSDPKQRVFNSAICLDFIQKHIRSLRERLDWHDQNDGRLKAAADRANEQLRKTLSDLHAAQDDVRCLHVDIAALQRLNKRHSSNSNSNSPVDLNINLSDSFTSKAAELTSDLYRHRQGGRGGSPSRSLAAEESSRSVYQYQLWGAHTPRRAAEDDHKTERGQDSSRSRNNVSLTEIYHDIDRLQGRLESRMKASLEDR